ncbi:3-hydroxyacyl-CoA dehydrogenase NAD-binding domain-containing protein [Xanthobacter sp. V3C-3]|uniref:3-hydroxyacyl-CoA dehydrogenase NAD-binding domain-containing protein n=1 Tax=Xanthobacter lutulentifluminis TaxID=3119935 RepID=UPI00372905F7
MPVTAHIEDGVGIIVFSNPPLNPISATAGIPQAIEAALLTLDADPQVKAIVLAAEGRMFSAGADIAEFDKDPQAIAGPARRLDDVLDGLAKPVVSAIQGGALGGGLELALATDYRIATSGAKLGLPEVTLGIIPGAGGTQRLARLTGAAPAAQLISSGKTIDAVEAHCIGLLDGLAEDDVRSEAIAFARSVAAAGRRRSRDRDIAGDGGAEAIAEARRKAPPGATGDAVRGALEAIETGMRQGFDAGLAAEYAIFDRLLVSEPARGLRHAFLSERAVARVPGLDPGLKVDPVRAVAIIGSGTMGTGIALAVAQAGLPVTVIDANAAALERSRSSVDGTIARAVERGRLSAAQGAAQRGRIGFSLDMEAVRGADFVIEAVFEDLSVKQQVFEALDRLADAGAVLASNTSTLDLDRIAAFTSRPQSVVGTHFFSPANIMRLLEVVRGAKTDPATLARAMAFARQIRKVGVVSGVCDGFIGNRMFEEYLRQAYFLLEEGALPQQVDAAMEAWGMAMGPLRTMDLAGQDIGWSIRKRRAVEQPDRPYSVIPDLICAMGRYGQKTGAGYYLYPRGGKPEVDPAIDALVVEESRRLGIARRPISDEEIVERCVYALVNEGARALEEGIAARPLDIDTVWVCGYGFPRFRGGPMFYADRVGLPHVLSRIKDFAGAYQGWAWTPADLLRRAAEAGTGFAPLNGEVA